MNEFAGWSKKETEWSTRSLRAQAVACHAFERLMQLAEVSNSGQSRTVACFLASTFDGQNFPLDSFDLRAMDLAISDDIPAVCECLALR